MDPIDRWKLKALNHKIVEDVKVSDVFPQLLERNILSEDDFDSIHSLVSTRERMQRLLLLLPEKGPRAYGVFLSVLNEDFQWLAQKLEALEPDEGQLASDKAYLELEISDEVVNLLKSNTQVVKRWPSLAHSLGMSVQKTQLQIQANVFLWDMDQIVVQLLEQWKSARGTKATVGCLLKALRKEQFNAAADSVEKMLT